MSDVVAGVSASAAIPVTKKELNRLSRLDRKWPNGLTQVRGRVVHELLTCEVSVASIPLRTRSSTLLGVLLEHPRNWQPSATTMQTITPSFLFQSFAIENRCCRERISLFYYEPTYAYTTYFASWVAKLPGSRLKFWRQSIFAISVFPLLFRQLIAVYSKRSFNIFSPILPDASTALKDYRRPFDNIAVVMCWSGIFKQIK